jgi:hypothetical protein
MTNYAEEYASPKKPQTPKVRPTRREPDHSSSRIYAGEQDRPTDRNRQDRYSPLHDRILARYNDLQSAIRKKLRETHSLPRWAVSAISSEQTHTLSAQNSGAQPPNRAPL